MASEDFPENYVEELCRFPENGGDCLKMDEATSNEATEDPFNVQQTCSLWPSTSGLSLSTDLYSGEFAKTVLTRCCERVIAHDVIKYHAPKPRQAEPSLVHTWCNSISSVDNNLCLC